MDDLDILSDFPTGFEQVLDAGDLFDADLNVAELTGAGGAAATWDATASQIRHAAAEALKVKGLLDGVSTLTGDIDLSIGLRAALADVEALPSPFRSL